MDKEIRIIANHIYCVIENLNTKLMHKSEDEKNYGNETFEEIMDFYITSHAMSFLKNICLEQEKSLGTILNMRCILEAKALLKCYKKGDLNEKQIDLFKLQYAIVEYRKYKEFFNMQNIIFEEDLKANYNNVVEKFKEYCPKSINLNRVLKTKMPCLLQEKASFEYLIKCYLSEAELCMYKTCSQFIHPNDNNTLWRIDINSYFKFILNYILEKYIICKENKIKGTFFQLYNLYVNEKDSISFKISEIVNKQVKELQKLIDVFIKFYGINYHSNTFLILTYLLKDITSDFLFGLTEQVKIKWKIVIEIFAIMDYLYNIGDDYENICNRYKLFVMHTKNQLFANNCVETKSDEIYNLYKNMFPSGLNKNDFDKQFSTTLGFLIGEKGMNNNQMNEINLTSMVKHFAYELKNPDIFSNYDISKIIILNYIESQILSHSNGYMYYSNSGAWGDCNSVIQAFDIILLYNLEKIFLNYKLHSIVEESNQYKTLRNCVRNVIKRYNDLMCEKFDLINNIKKMDRTRF